MWLPATGHGEVGVGGMSWKVGEAGVPRTSANDKTMVRLAAWRTIANLSSDVHFEGLLASGLAGHRGEHETPASPLTASASWKRPCRSPTRLEGQVLTSRSLKKLHNDGERGAAASMNVLRTRTAYDAGNSVSTGAQPSPQWGLASSNCGRGREVSRVGSSRGAGTQAMWAGGMGTN
jgi:hypothetical protein